MRWNRMSLLCHVLNYPGCPTKNQRDGVRRSIKQKSYDINLLVLQYADLMPRQVAAGIVSQYAFSNCQENFKKKLENGST